MAREGGPSQNPSPSLKKKTSDGDKVIRKLINGMELDWYGPGAPEGGDLGPSTPEGPEARDGSWAGPRERGTVEETASLQLRRDG